MGLKGESKVRVGVGADGASLEWKHCVSRLKRGGTGESRWSGAWRKAEEGFGAPGRSDSTRFQLDL